MTPPTSELGATVPVDVDGVTAPVGTSPTALLKESDPKEPRKTLDGNTVLWHAVQSSTHWHVQVSR